MESVSSLDNAKASLSVIIVSYNTREMTLECLRTLYGGLGSISAEVWVVDNASQDGSADMILAEFPQVRLVANDRNVGFGAANNQAMSRAQGEYFLLLNSDAFPAPQALRGLLEYALQHPEVAVAGPRLLNADGSLQVSCYRFPSPFRAWVENLWISAALPHHPTIGDYRRWGHDGERLVDFVSGACMLVRRSAYEQVGGFDEAFFMYSEETDWQRRMRNQGWEVGFTPAAEVTHFGGASGATETARINRHFFESLDYYEAKHHGTWGLVSLRAAMAIGSLLRIALWAAAMVLGGSRRTLAGSKVRLYTWLVRRQITCWPSAKAHV